MLQVRRTKYPSIRQMKNMLINLKNKYKKACSIQPILFELPSGRPELPGRVSVELYWFSVVDVFAGNIETWERLQLKYRELMRRKGD